MSYPTPTYYAHLVADRARKHHNELAQFDCGSSSGYSAGSGKMSEAKKREIKEAVEKGVQKPMYFVKEEVDMELCSVVTFPCKKKSSSLV